MKLSFRLRSSKSVSAFLLMVFALTSCDLYPESGEWVGDLSIAGENSHESYRCPVRLDLLRTSEVVSIRSLDLNCGSHSLIWRPSVYTRRGTELFREGQKVGGIYADGTVRLELREPKTFDRYPNRVSRLMITWTRLGDSLHFSLREEFDGKARTMEGRLQTTI